MTKKKHKIGTTILLALAPACALGITTGVLISSIKSGTGERVVTKAEWFAEYYTISANYQASRTSFNKDEIEFILDGEKQELLCIDTYPDDGDVRRTNAYTKDEFWPFISGPEYSELKKDVEDSTNVVYIISSEYLSIEMKTSTVTKKYVINRNGYILSYTYKDSYHPEGDEQYSVNYKVQPHNITKFEGYYYYEEEDKSHNYYGPYTYLEPNTEYTVECNLTQGTGYKYFFVNKPTPKGALLKDISITLDDVKLSSGLDWNIDSNNYIVFTNAINSGKLVIKFQIQLETYLEYSNIALRQKKS